jgi:hypothetical protein
MFVNRELGLSTLNYACQILTNCMPAAKTRLP